MKDILEIFYEDWDGEIVLSEVSNFTSEEEFLKYAQSYVDMTRGHHIPVSRTNVEVSSIVVNGGGWYSKLLADEKGFTGDELTVYKTNIDWEAVD